MNYDMKKEILFNEKLVSIIFGKRVLKYLQKPNDLSKISVHESEIYLLNLLVASQHKRRPYNRK